MLKRIQEIVNTIFRAEYNSINVKVVGTEHSLPVSLHSTIPTQFEYTPVIPAGSSWQSENIFSVEGQKTVLTFFADSDVEVWVYETNNNIDLIPRAHITVSGSSEVADVVDIIPTRQWLVIEINNAGASEANVQIGVSLLN